MKCFTTNSSTVHGQHYLKVSRYKEMWVPVVGEILYSVNRNEDSFAVAVMSTQ